MGDEIFELKSNKDVNVKLNIHGMKFPQNSPIFLAKDHPTRFIAPLVSVLTETFLEIVDDDDDSCEIQAHYRFYGQEAREILLRWPILVTELDMLIFGGRAWRYQFRNGKNIKG